jgi:hypothetical protein
MSRAFTSLPPRSPPRRPTEPAPIARWYPMELQPPLNPPLFPPHRLTIRKHLLSVAEAHTAAQRLLTADPSLAHLGPLLAPTAFVDDGYIGLGIPIGTDAFVQHFVKKKCQEIMDDVDKLDNIQDGFIHYQLVRFWQATRLQYLNGQIDLANQNVLQQQHVDWKISNALLKKGTRDAYKTWNQQDSTWVDMRLHESYDEGGFGVSNNTITRHAASYTTNARFVAFLGTFAQ